MSAITGRDTSGEPIRSPLPHSADVAMVGAGQLARMTLQAAVDLDIRLEVLASGPDDPAVRAGAAWRIGRADDLGDLGELAAAARVLTLDHEGVPPAHLERLAAAGHTVRPGAAAARLASDKLHARRQMKAAGFPVPRFAEARSLADVTAFAGETGWPVVLKARAGGYDGRGVHVVRDPREAADVMGGEGGWLVEEHVLIDREISVLVARRPGGEVAVYPIAETLQQEGICRELVMPAAIPDELATRARDLAASLVSGADVCGVAAVEMFITATGDLMICELAVRPHNSGHATIEGCETSQFHNHLRGILDWPLGSTGLRAPAVALVNVLGSGDNRSSERLPDALAVPGASVHLYGKHEDPGRKIGHVTATGRTREQALDRARTAAAVLSGDAPASAAFALIGGGPEDVQPVLIWEIGVSAFNHDEDER